MPNARVEPPRADGRSAPRAQNGEARFRRACLLRVGEFRVVEVVEVYQDAKTIEVVGFNILGPGSDETWLYSLEEVEPKLKELTAKPST